MKKTIAGILYDTEADEDVFMWADDGGRDQKIMQTPTGHLYLSQCWSQIHDGSGWIDETDLEMLEKLCGTTDRKVATQQNRLRCIYTIRPMTKAEAWQWFLVNVVPEQLRPAAPALDIPKHDRNR